MSRCSAGFRWMASLAAVYGGTAALLGRMRREMLHDGRFRKGTAVAVYVAYAAHGAVVAVAVRQRRPAVPLPRRAARVGGAFLVAVGAGLSVAGMRRFGDAAQVSGVRPGDLSTGGVYRYSRNPQYLGAGLALAGAGLAFRNGLVLLQVVGSGLVFRWWVRVEERHLEQYFGASYRRYLNTTNRWLGRPAGS